MEKHIPKEIMTEDGHLYQLKRPLHKQGWFWVSIASWFVSAILFLTLVGFFILNAVLAANGGNVQRFLDGDTYYQNAESYEEHVLGESTTLDGGATLTVESIKEDSSRPLADDGTGQAVVVRLKIENKTPTAMTLNPYYFTLYDYIGNVYLLDTSTFDKGAWTKTIEPGQSETWELVFDGEDGSEGNYHLIYNDRIRWWQEQEIDASNERI